MAYNVHFSKGSATAYAELPTKDPGTLYFITDSNAPAFYLGEQKLSSLAEVINIASRCDGEDTRLQILEDLLYEFDFNKKGNVKTVIDNIASDIRDEIGVLNTLKTTAHNNVVNAVNEVYDTVTQDKSDLTVTVTTDEDRNNILKKYTINQGGVKLAEIDIPKDLVVKSGRLVTVKASTQDLTDWEELEDNSGVERPLSEWIVVGSSTGETITSSSITKAGSYIELTINVSDGSNLSDTKIYIDVSKLIDAYSTEQNATQVQLSIVGYTISGRIVSQSITSAELATNSVTTIKIADLNVTKAKLEQSVQHSLDLADTAIQSIVTGSTNYGFYVDGGFVQVCGLDSAALKPETAFDVAGAAENVRGTNVDAANVGTVWGAHAHADLAESNANTYTDNALTWGEIGAASSGE